MAPKISKYSTALIIKYFHIKTACSLFLTARVAKIKQKAMDAPTVSVLLNNGSANHCGAP